MHSQPRRLLSLAVVALVLAAGTAGAQGKGHDKGKGKGDEKKVEHSNGDVRVNRDDPRVSRVDPRVNRVDPRVNRVDPRYANREGYRNGVRIPPGLAKKPGGMPPGQYRKRYGTPQGAVVLRDVLVQRGYTVVRTQPYGESQYVYYRMRDGSIRRAIVTPGTDRLGFTNVPASLLSEVLARLY
jgi:hypothetical protein